MIPMQQSSIKDEVLSKIEFKVGNPEDVKDISSLSIDRPFSDERIAFLDALSKKIKEDSRSRQYPDVLTFAFFIRKGNMILSKKRFSVYDEKVYVCGKGVVFHIAPSNVAVNFAYSFVTGFITGNANIVRTPTKYFEQVDIICNAVLETLKDYPDYQKYIYFVKYGHDKDINDFFSSICNVRVVWGGDNTINELRKSPLKPRAGEILFADRYSLAVIDADSFLQVKHKGRIAADFYNDTYLTDQNACTSPRLICWLGSKEDIERAKETFWDEVYRYAKKHYIYQDIQGVDKLSEVYISAALMPGVKIIRQNNDNLLVRVEIPELDKTIIDHRGNSGLFYEYELEDISDLASFCDERIQTITYFGENIDFKGLLDMRIYGVDRIVFLGHSMDFDFIWDGYNLVEELTRKIYI